MDDLDPLAQQDPPEPEQRAARRRKGRRAHNNDRQVVNLQTIGQEAHASSLPVGVGQYNDGVTVAKKAFTQVVQMGFHPAGVRAEEVGDEPKC